jgi:D-alanyl-D-alanine dipeptidase
MSEQSSEHRILLLSDPRVAALPITDTGEALLDVREAGLRLDGRKREETGAYARLRSGVVERLLVAQRRLPASLSLLVIEGHRPAWLQRDYFEEHLAELRGLYPRWSADRLRVEASAYISPPGVAPHPCGAAVDLTLCRLDGAELPMGTRVNASPGESDNACFMAASNIPTEARENRLILAGALSAAGLVNYPTEWWHWSFGDRYWAATTGAPAALYGPLG